MKGATRSNFRCRRGNGRVLTSFPRHSSRRLQSWQSRWTKDREGWEREQRAKEEGERKREREGFRVRSWKEVLFPFYWLTSCFALSASTGNLSRWIFRENRRKRARTRERERGGRGVGFLWLPSIPSTISCASLRKPLTPCIFPRPRLVASLFLP